TIEGRQGSRHTSSYGAVGAVVGATYPQQLAELRAAISHAWFLVPGFGAQGGAARDVAPAFDAQGLGAIVNNSRGIIFAHARKEFAGRFAASDWQRAVEAATQEMIEQLRAETTAGRLTEALETGEEENGERPDDVILSEHGDHMTVREALHQVLEDLPDERVAEVLDFAAFLRLQDDRNDWRRFGLSQLSAAYGSDEPEYSPADIKPELD